MCSPLRGCAALPHVFGQEGRYIMIEVKSFGIEAISDTYAISNTVKQVAGTHGIKDLDAITGVLPNGCLIGRLTTYVYEEELREVIFIVTPNGKCEFVGYTPAGKPRILYEREINFILSACLDYGFTLPAIISGINRKFKYINLSKVLSE